ncbi:hypothetical protein MDAP_000962 [Mitosporidium daphniae]|uniref:Transcription initiation factor TFIID subunit 10 n=1 Tax=Mitosporidium daphniae TaxID=1485682 RepID=A0A098VV63_9MICR|nr:uncharacterized protein DI09_132p30 [Mitosporidium daphniae]KGG52810.1 hypothetical protein DI09_132p30 [Mitosporidium daphniae]|eukprot:XP_013239246.1 uncharacterized protein DI09_132p30 [Mitosporidium daphniae]
MDEECDQNYDDVMDYGANIPKDASLLNSNVGLNTSHAPINNIPHVDGSHHAMAAALSGTIQQPGQLFRASPLSALIQQQQHRASALRQQLPSSHFLPLGATKYPTADGERRPPQVTPTSTSIPPAEATRLSETSLEAKFEEDKALLELLRQLEHFTPIIPDPLMDMVMARAGLDSPDVKLKRLLALMAQKFITDVAQDAMQYSRIRSNGVAAPATTAPTSKADRKASKERRFVLTLEDLNAALQDHGVVSRRPPYYR